MRISDWSSDVCSSDLVVQFEEHPQRQLEVVIVDELVNRAGKRRHRRLVAAPAREDLAHLLAQRTARSGKLHELSPWTQGRCGTPLGVNQSGRRNRSSTPRSPWERTSSRSEEHTSELQSLMRISYAVFCLKKKITKTTTQKKT